jgi:L-alanine-DL-glutamate epimerase-like enolase superfamily enzyme
MKITDVMITLFGWESIPSTICGHHTARPTGKSDLGLLAVTTDEGITGHAFLGTSSNPASLDGPGLIRFLKPVLMGQNPLDRKIHAPQSWREDIKVCEAVRKAVGDDYTVMLDSTWSYRYEEALRVGRAIEEMGFYWYEDPLVEQDIYNYVKLKQKLDIPILATEFPIAGFDSYAPWIMQCATDFLRGDVAVKGGITTLVKTAHLAEAFHMNMEVHHGGNSLNNVANLHVIMAIGNTEFFEVLLPDAMQKYGLAEDITVDRDGLVQAPTEPGLGAKIDFELIERKKLGVLS